MAAATQNDWETNLAQLLKEISDVQGDLLDVLQAKRERMAKGEYTKLDDLQERERELGDRLQACHDKRTELLERAGECGLPSDSIGSLAKVLPSEERGEIKKQVEEAARRARLLQQETLTNWVLAQRSLLHVSQILEIFATGGRLKPTYGNGEFVHSRGALMDREV
ncbi:MAG: flagellar export chaperone FlgN [Pirellulaceae bacterium]|jgi:flagellar biosynthesis/type III secretory pathway chaperone|nr:flagellar export chaperone FlgN [Pirellulaceae bacterium]MDP7016676.1 flagellar export chaperone FlgN [Pirellulaceae bacterium]